MGGSLGLSVTVGVGGVLKNVGIRRLVEAEVEKGVIVTKSKNTAMHSGYRSFLVKFDLLFKVSR
jgi:hypothetical protein